MKIPAILFASLPILLAAGCGSMPGADEGHAALAADARRAAGALIQQLGGELKQSLASKGPVETIAVCKEKAPAIAAAVSAQSGFDVRRVSPRNRNPNAVPDAWEAEAQAQLEKRLAAGEKPDTLETWQVVETPAGKVFRYAKALPVQPLCLTCHGETLPDALRARLDADYPGDRATGYRVGMLRGIVSVKRPL
jgi:hypothetical protein